MNGRVLIDTNILVYIYDSAEVEKQEKAITVVGELIESNRAVISPQVMGEFFIATTRAKRTMLSVDEAMLAVSNYISACHFLPITEMIILEALRGVKSHNLPYWDAQIWATARLNQIAEIYSEDFKRSANLEGVSFINPFC